MRIHTICDHKIKLILLWKTHTFKYVTTEDNEKGRTVYLHQATHRGNWFWHLNGWVHWKTLIKSEGGKTQSSRSTSATTYATWTDKAL